MIEIPDHIPNLSRLRLLYAFFLLLLGVIIARLWYLQIAKGPELAAMADEQRTRLVRRVAARGTILDAKGRLLATNRPHFVISVLPDELKKNPQVLPRLAQMLQTTEDDLTAKIDQNKTTPFDPVPVASDVTMELLTQIEEQKLDLPGVLIVEDPKRDYVDNQICTHILGVARPISAAKLEKLRVKGYRGGDIIGVEGLEAVYESDLRGKEGGQRIEVDAKGRMRRSLEEIKPKAGHTLRLTIDRDLQQTAYNSLKVALNQGNPGAAVAIDPNDGAVLAFVSMPSYDLNRYGVDYPKLSQDKLMTPLVNRVSSSHYPVGSTYKLVTAAAGLESGVIAPNTYLYCGGSINVGRMRFHCDLRSGHGSLSLERAIGESCDVFFYRVGQMVGREKLAETAKKFGLGQPTGIDLPPSVDAKGIVPTAEWKKKTKRGVWVPGDLINMSIGQGYVGVTPLQLVSYAAALANGGTLLRPQLVREITDTSSGSPVVVHRLQREERGSLGLTPEHRDAIVAGMARAFRAGTASPSAVPGLAAAGKTGTVEVYRYGQKRPNNSVFVCFAPVDHPKIAIAVLVESGGFGADSAAPIAQRMLAQFFHIKMENYHPIGNRHTGGRD